MRSPYKIGYDGAQVRLKVIVNENKSKLKIGSVLKGDFKNSIKYESKKKEDSNEIFEKDKNNIIQKNK